MINNVQKQALWKLLEQYYVFGSVEGARSIAEILTQQDTFVLTNFEADIVDFSLNGNEAALRQVAETCLREEVLPIEHHVELVATWLTKSLIVDEEAYNLLRNREFSLSKSNDERLKKLADIVWLLSQDESAGALSPTADHMLRDALLAFN